MSGLRSWILAAALLVVSVVSQEEKQVNLKQGPIYATGQPVGDGRSIYSFKGIPYAKPPVGDLRFMAPVPDDGWSDPRNGSMDPMPCPQFDFMAFLNGTFTGIGSEDCLYLNVFTPKPFPSADLPVMVFIHGGGFQGGDASLQPLPLLTKDVVLVALQYRLGALGFLSMEDSVLSGNMGLKDQTMALQWIQDNIKDLGGDPKKVTIFGESAGGASVHFHVLSPHSKGLFHQAITQSGTMLCPWAKFSDHRNAALKMAETLECPSSDDVDSKELLSCLRDAPVEKLLLAPGSVAVWNSLPAVTLPRVDGDFLPDRPAALLKNGEYNKVPMMAGVTRDEGSIFTAGFSMNPNGTDFLKENFTVAGPISLGFTEADGNPSYLARRAYYHYVGFAEMKMDRLNEFTDLMSDRHFKRCHEDAMAIHARDSVFGDHVYKYELQHRGNQSLMGTNPEWVGHGDDLQYLFDAMLPFKSLERDDDIFVSEIMVALWTNFAIHGNPTPDLSLGFKWTSATPENDMYLGITTSPMMKNYTNDKIREFWMDMPTEENKILYPERF